MAVKYLVLTGLSYPTPKGEVRVEPGETVEDLPKKSAEWLLRQGHIEELEGGDD